MHIYMHTNMCMYMYIYGYIYKHCICPYHLRIKNTANYVCIPTYECTLPFCFCFCVSVWFGTMTVGLGHYNECVFAA